MEILNIH